MLPRHYRPAESPDCARKMHSPRRPGPWPQACMVAECACAQVPSAALSFAWQYVFPQRVCRSIRELATLGAIMSTRSRCKGQ